MEIKNLFESAYCRRLILAYIIDVHGPVSTIGIESLVSWPKNTIKSNISGLRDMGIEVEFVGSKKLGGYKLNSWGAIKKSWVRLHYDEILDALYLFSSKGG